MKLGLTPKQQAERLKRKAGKKTIFAWIPKLCWNTQRYVWLEKVEEEIVYDSYYPDTGGYLKYHYKEIE